MFLPQHSFEHADEITHEPSGLYSYTIAIRSLNIGPGSDLAQEEREVDAGIDGELQRSPKSPVHFHQKRLPPPRIEFVLYHGNAMPVERVKQAHGIFFEKGINRNTFAEHADPARGR